MNKVVFLHQLRIRLSQLSESEISTRLDYYSEIIDDMVEDGKTEEEAVSSFGNINELTQGILQETPLSTLVKSKVKPKGGWSSGAIAIAVIGFPLWFPLLAAFVCILLSFYLVIWALIISVFAIVLSLGVMGIVLLVRSLFLFGSGLPFVAFTIGCGFASLGLCLLSFLGSKAIALSLIRFSTTIINQVKSLFIKKEVA